MSFKDEIKKNLFITENNVPYAQFINRNRTEVCPVFSDEFKEKVKGLYYDEEKRVPTPQQLDEIKSEMGILAARSEQIRPVWVRTSRAGEGIEIDLNNKAGQCVFIHKDGWAVRQTEQAFYRSPSSLELPVPQKGGDWDIFKKHFKTKTDDDLCLIIGFMLGCLKPKGPYPLLVIQGEQGTAKSTTASMIKALVDPDQAKGRALSKKEQDLFIVAKNNHLLSFDNVSHIQNELSDVLCRVATGGTFSTRALYTDDTEKQITICKPVILNGITNFVSRPDLMNRCITIELAVIEEKDRKTEREVWDEFNSDRPFMLGVLMDALSGALKNQDEVKLGSLPRMADFARFVSAAELTIGWGEGRFLSILKENETAARVGIVCEDPFATAVLDFMRGVKGEVWEGASSQLLMELEFHKPPYVTGGQWPTSPNYLSSKLRRFAPALRDVGIDVMEPVRTAKERVQRIRKMENFQPVGGKEEAVPLPVSAMKVPVWSIVRGSELDQVVETLPSVVNKKDTICFNDLIDD